MRPKFAMLLLITAPLPCMGQPSASTDCPDRDKLAAICIQVKTQSRHNVILDGNPYNYYRSILDASCVAPNDRTEDRNQKIKMMWDQLGPTLTCQDAAFEVTGGNIIKYAASMNFDRFIRDVSRWGIDLNQIDSADGRTTLDYLRDMVRKYEGTGMEAKLQMYYDQLRRAGAKHRSEL